VIIAMATDITDLAASVFSARLYAVLESKVSETAKHYSIARMASRLSSRS